ncbi:helix-turn-helix domain-containing protein [Halobacillus massiliensis]|uniref:helix-turn-helix domain-containing protein n=1 Tax=Halobacillus massiliensis TaxID=1926286 RepID=UPI0015C42ED6|nr:helix-turn-helix transcriptional regulator [Halobacillus massiliensis]
MSKNMMKKRRQLFGTAVRNRRIEMNLTQEELAEAIRVSPTFISNIETGDKFPSMDNMFNLNDALGGECIILGVKFQTSKEHLTKDEKE